MNISEIVDSMYEDLLKVSAFRHNTLGVPGFHTSMKRLGVNATQMRSVISEWNKILHDFTTEQWIELCIQLTQNGVFECQIMAYEILWTHKKVLKSLNHKQILILGERLDNWASTDAYGTMIAGWHWREGTLPESQILAWLNSDDRWYRRLAVVCTVPLNIGSRGGSGDPKRTLMICRKALADRDDMVVKAVSWALRELSKTDKKAVENFMDKYREQLHPRVRREVTAKLLTGRKNG
ncbi:DNA alkylation repair protein [Maribellus sediminis]|uniref:DNA alkylation repair protein n=1 Tax=Maribellus sediminis TaxID=2696285 RepID=UPI0014301383|nr:DNA alkylation repair protein [Maribellus sediminis]